MSSIRNFPTWLFSVWLVPIARLLDHWIVDAIPGAQTEGKLGILRVTPSRTLDGGPCGREARMYCRSQALLQLVSCRGRLSERSCQILAERLLCERCQYQTDQARQWLDALALTVLKKQTLLEFHNHEEWVTSWFNEIVRGRHQMQAESWPKWYRAGPGAVLLDNDIRPAQK